MTFTWTAPDPLNNTTKTRSIYVSELQVAVNVKRAEIGLPPISFIDQSVGKKFRLSAIEELKTTLNDLAILYGYPTGVQDSALLGRPYVEITKKYGKYVCHYPILNDLRIVLNLLSVRVILYMDYVLNYAHPTEDRNLANLNILVNPTLKSLAKSQFSWNARCRVACDFDYIYRGYPSGVGDSFIYKENIITGINLAVVNIPNFFVRDICVDDTYVYLSGIDTLTGLIIYVKRILKSNLTGLTNLEIISIPNFIFGSSPSIICDKN
jgi:hypothetical protein